MEVKLLDHQWDALDTDKKYTLLLGGIGSGKTHCGAAWLMKKYQESPDSLGLITANTFGQLQKATLTSAFRLLGEWGIPFSYNQQKSLLVVNNRKKFLCLGLDNYDVHRGIEVGEWWGDEVAYNKDDAFRVMSGRLRDRNGKLDVLFTSSPNGYNWLYHFFSPQGDEYNESKVKLVKAKTSSNIYLPEGYEDDLRSQYNSRQAAQELDGEFVNMTTGQIYWAFERDRNVDELKFSRNHPVLIGMDFNVSPMTAVVCQLINGTLNVLDEIYLMDSNTFEMARTIQSRFGIGHTIFPDSTGANRSTKSHKSDHDILRDHEFNVMKSKNPFRIDRYNRVNGLLEKNNIKINNKCVQLIKDLEQVSYKQGTNQPDTTDKSLTHISDALGYVVWGAMRPSTAKGFNQSRVF